MKGSLSMNKSKNNSLQNLCTTLDLYQTKTIAILSADDGAGKSTVADNVAVRWAKGGKKVLLVDANVIASQSHSISNSFQKKGLTDLLASHGKPVVLEDYFQKSSFSTLNILPIGTIKGEQGTKLLRKYFANFLSIVVDKYDKIIFEFGSLLLTPSVELAQIVDGVVLIVRFGKTSSEEVAMGIQQLKLARVNILGYVMNDVTKS